MIRWLRARWFQPPAASTQNTAANDNSSKNAKPSKIHNLKLSASSIKKGSLSSLPSSSDITGSTALSMSNVPLPYHSLESSDEESASPSSVASSSTATTSPTDEQQSRTSHSSTRRRVIFTDTNVPADKLIVEGVDEELSPIRAEPMAVVRTKKRELVRRRTANERDDVPPGVPIYRVALLGCPDSGKSTLLRQFRGITRKNKGSIENIADDGGGDDDPREMRMAMQRNVVEGVRKLLHTMTDLELSMANEENNAAFEIFEQMIGKQLVDEGFYDDEQNRRLIVSVLERVQVDSGFQQVWAHAHDGEALRHFLQRPQIFDPSYVPNEEDLLRLRVPTAGAVMTRVVCDAASASTPIALDFVDFGGYRFQRATTWTPYFASSSGANTLNLLIYLHSLTCYTQQVEEDSHSSQFEESVEVFEELARNAALKSVPLILLLNKKDALKRMLDDHPLSKYFPDFNGGTGYQAAVDYFKQCFMQALTNTNPHRPFFVYMTDAFDRPALRSLLGKINEIVQQRQQLQQR